MSRKNYLLLLTFTIIFFTLTYPFKSFKFPHQNIPNSFQLILENPSDRSEFSFAQIQIEQHHYPSPDYLFLVALFLSSNHHALFSPAGIELCGDQLAVGHYHGFKSHC